MPTVTLIGTGDGTEFVASSGQNSIAVGGSGLSAGELLLVSLGACAGGRVNSYLRRRGISKDQLRVEISSERIEDVAHYKSIRVLLHLDRSLSQEEEEELYGMFFAGRIHTTLTKGADIQYQLDIRSE